MIKYYLILLTFIISSIPSVAIDKDSLSTFNKSSETIKKESNMKVSKIQNKNKDQAI